MTNKPAKQQKSLLFLACMRQYEKGFTLDAINEYMRMNGIPEARRNDVIKEVKHELRKRWQYGDE